MPAKTDHLLDRAISIVRDGPRRHREYLETQGEPFGHLWAFTPDERADLGRLQALLQTWLCRPGPERPLCIALFGPPGAGKSFAVGELLRAYKTHLPLKDRPAWAKDFRSFVFNLTQFEHAQELALALSKVPGRVDEGELPVVFFDEFDAPRGARELGWLPWFLAPMQDGEWVLEGQSQVLRRAIYVFAGGTCHSFQGFADRASKPGAEHDKATDFSSRLRGTLDIRGMDTGDHAALRRALILHHQLAAYNATWLGAPGNQPKTLDDDVIRWLLSGVSGYRHGARSLGALLDGCRVGPQTAVITMEMLPVGPMRAAHVVGETAAPL